LVTIQEEETVADLDVRIVRLNPMRVASWRAVSRTPERDAWQKLAAWAEPKGLLNNLEKHPVFGFNNPNPSPERPEYGYEFWIRIDAKNEPEGDIEVKEFPGGLYAVTTCQLQGDPLGNVPEIWMMLGEWVQSSDHKWRPTHELEKPQDPLASEDDMVLDLFLPITE
jgi:DNA gyrase inhibitor GyrI